MPRGFPRVSKAVTTPMRSAVGARFSFPPVRNNAWRAILRGRECDVGRAAPASLAIAIGLPLALRIFAFTAQ